MKFTFKELRELAEFLAILIQYSSEYDSDKPSVNVYWNHMSKIYVVEIQ